jgi:hypothetical protein
MPSRLDALEQMGLSSVLESILIDVVMQENETVLPDSV